MSAAVVAGDANEEGNPVSVDKLFHHSRSGHIEDAYGNVKHIAHRIVIVQSVLLPQITAAHLLNFVQSKAHPWLLPQMVPKDPKW